MSKMIMNKTIKKVSLSIVSAAALLTSSLALAEPQVGQPAPDFDVVDSQGNAVSLSSLKGKTVVMEWTNHDCPFVKKHYESGNMQALQKSATSDDVVWVSVISSGEGKQGNVSADQANSLTEQRGAAPTHVVLDPSGDLGRAYAARTTPHMFVINETSELVYMGGIDDVPSADKADIEGANNYVSAALANLKNNEAVATPTTRPYGCSVKYSS